MTTWLAPLKRGNGGDTLHSISRIKLDLYGTPKV